MKTRDTGVTERMKCLLESLKTPSEFQKLSAEEKIDYFIEYIKKGYSLYIQTHLKTWKITPRSLRSWEKSGDTLLRARGNNMEMASGRKFVNINHCTFTLQRE